MKKWFKCILISLCLLLISPAKSQNSMEIGSGNYGAWQLSNKSCYGCGSFFVMVVNNPKPAKGYYYYDIYLWSNSFYTNGYAANTYVKQISVYTLDPEGKEYFIFKMPYVVVAPKSESFNGYFYLGYVYSTSAMQDVKIKWFNSSAW